MYQQISQTFKIRVITLKPLIIAFNKLPFQNEIRLILFVSILDYFSIM